MSDRIRLMHRQLSQLSASDTSRSSSRMSKSSVVTPSFVTPQLIANAYGIDDTTGHPLTTQAVRSFGDKYFCPDDLTRYQTILQLPIKVADKSYGGFKSTEYCQDNGGSCTEGNLDIPIVMGVADTSTVFLYIHSIFANLMATVIAQTSPPHWLRISAVRWRKGCFQRSNKVVEFKCHQVGGDGSHFGCCIR